MKNSLYCISLLNVQRCLKDSTSSKTFAIFIHLLQPSSPSPWIVQPSRTGVPVAVGRWAGKAQHFHPDGMTPVGLFAVKQEYLLPKQHSLGPHFIIVSLQICAVALGPWKAAPLAGFSVGFVARKSYFQSFKKDPAWEPVITCQRNLTSEGQTLNNLLYPN